MSATISIIVAHDDQLGIGKQNNLLFRISADLKRFKQLTMGHPIIMGRKTYESIGKPLSGRTNIIITRNKNYPAESCQITHSLKEAIDLAKKEDQQEIFIIGGGQIYKQALDQNLVDKLYITKVKGDYQAEIFFPNYQNFTEVVAKKDLQAGDYSYTYLTLKKSV